jgi:hypothetical protein
MIPRPLILITLLCNLAFGQNSEPLITTEFLTIALDEPVADLYYKTAETVTPFAADLTGLSQPNPYKGPKQFVLRTSAAEFALKPPLPAPAATAILPATADRVLLACVKSQDKPLRIAAYDISSKGSKAGDYRFFNFCTKTLSVIIGTEKFALAPGKDQVISSQAWRESVLDLPMQVAKVDGNKAKLVYSTVWGHRPGRRNFIFMFDGRHPSKPVAISRFFDIPPAQAKATP